jgi:lysophospholipase L1-like esterase
MSMVEIYKEKIRDLLRVQKEDNLKIREDRIKGVYIENVYESFVNNET